MYNENMNLLPTNLMRRKQLCAQCKRLAAVQVVIFLLFVLTVGIIELILHSHETQRAGIILQLQDERFTASETEAQALRDHIAKVEAGQRAVELLDLPVFNTYRLDMICHTLPEGVILTHIDKTETGAILTNYTEDLSLSDIHRDAWMATGLVSRVQLTSAVVTDTGGVRYILSLHWEI